MMTLNLDTGKVLWDTRLSQIANGDATVSNNLVFTTTFDGYLLALARNDGQAVCCKKLPAFTNAPIAIEGDTLVTAASYPARASGCSSQMTAGTTASIRWSPGSVSARVRCSASSSAVSACAAGTPIACASPTWSSRRRPG
jgi:outer membrane protein assembly factor BamB